MNFLGTIIAEWNCTYITCPFIGVNNGVGIAIFHGDIQPLFPLWMITIEFKCIVCTGSIAKSFSGIRAVIAAGSKTNGDDCYQQKVSHKKIVETKIGAACFLSKFFYLRR